MRTFELGIENFNSTYSRSFNLSAGLRTGSNDYEKGLGGGLELAYRKYASPMKFRSRNSRESYQGIYYSLFAKGEYFKGEDPYYSSASDNYSEKISSVRVGFTIGFRKTLWQIIILDIYAGGGYRYSDVQTTGYYNQSSYGPQYDIFDPGYSGIYPKTDVKIGIGL